jgi:urease accessory protein
MRYAMAILAVALLPGAALAHPGQDHVHTAAPFLAGLAHPVGGLDHLLAMVAVGLLAAVMGGRASWALPLGFVGAMAVGGAVGSAGVALPDVEPVILASVIVLGATLALALRPPLAVTVAAVAVFGFAHGAAHGLEGPQAGVVAYALGFVLATAALHLVGITAGMALERLGRAAGPRMLGGAATVAGVVMVFV